jgi:hypothetical protein
MFLGIEISSIFYKKFEHHKIAMKFGLMILFAIFLRFRALPDWRLNA